MKWSDLLSERMIFGVLVIGGYYTLVIVGIHATKDTISASSAAIIHDAMLTGGPLVGIIVNAIWKTDKADKQNAQTTATLATALAANQNPSQNGGTIPLSPAQQGPTP